MTPSFPDSGRTGSVLALILLCYATLYLVWGSTYLFIKLAVQSIPPCYVVGIRFFCGGVLFMLFSLASGRVKRMPTLPEIRSAVILGSLLLMGGNGLVTFAERKVDSYLAALIISTTPVVVGLFDRLIFGKKLSKFRWVGIAAGVCGVALLLSGGKFRQVAFTPETGLVIGGLVSWALATSLGHRMKVYPDLFVNSGLQMLFVGSLGMVWLIFVQPPSMDLIRQVTPVSFGGLLYLSVFGSLAFGAYTFLVRHEPAIRVVSYSFVNPLIAIVLGITVVGEPVRPMLVPATFLILIGLFAMLYGDALFGRPAVQVSAAAAKG